MSTFSLRTAAAKKDKLALSRRPPEAFRLQDEIRLASSDKYNDAYDCFVSARRIRDRYAVSVQINNAISHTPVVYNANWIFNDMETCWAKYHAIRDIVKDIRDFIEAEGLKTIIWQYMVKHSLSAISSDVEDIYETTLGRPAHVADESTRGNIIKNFPMMPFRSQSGPDKLHEVFESVGNAENPIPQNDRIKGGLVTHKHVRKEMRLKDVVPCPLSSFQIAAGLGEHSGMVKGAAATGTIKTAESKDPEAAFIEKVNGNSENAVKHGREAAIRHYMVETGTSLVEAEAFYEATKAAVGDAKIILNASLPSMIAMFVQGEWSPETEVPETVAVFSRSAKKREQAERAMGCPISPTYASVTMLPEGDRGYGKCALALCDVADKAVLLCGDSFRTRNPSRSDYADEPSKILYAFRDLPDCKAAATIQAMGKSEFARGPAAALASLLDSDREFGRCEALIFGKVGPANVSEIVVPNAEDARKARKVLNRLGIMLPVSHSGRDPKIISLDADKEPEDEPQPKEAEMRHFAREDRVCLKPMASRPPKSGHVVDASNGQVVVEWNGGEREIFGLAEALMELMDAPSEASSEYKGMVTYSMPGMDENAIMDLNAAGVDAVTLWGIISHCAPAAKDSSGWIEHTIEALKSLGLQANAVCGHVPNEDGDDAFVKREWVEAELPTGARLVIDASSGTPKVCTGEADDYIRPDEDPNIELE